MGEGRLYGGGLHQLECNKLGNGLGERIFKILYRFQLCLNHYGRRAAQGKNEQFRRRRIWFYPNCSATNLVV